MFSTLIFCCRLEFFQLITLIIETFARQTFANFASFRLFRESLCRKNLKTAIRESLSREFFRLLNSKFSDFFNHLPYQPKFLKEHFLVQIHSFCIFSYILNVIPKNKSRNLCLRSLNTVLEILAFSFILI